MTRITVRIVVSCLIASLIVFLAGYQLAKSHYQRQSVIPVISVYAHEAALREAAQKYQYPGTLGFPLKTPLVVEGEAYIDGAGFPMQSDLLQLTSVTCQRLNITLTIDNAVVPDKGSVRYEGYEAMLDGQRQFVVTKELPLTMKPSHSNSSP